MNKKQGFTLIELLAVIIILAAVALIIAPLVLDIIKEQKMKTFKESINGVLRSSRLELVNSGLSFPATFTYSDGKLSSPTGKELKVTGKIPNGSGTVTYKSEDDIDLAIHDNDWCGKYNKTNKEVEVTEYDGECDAIAYTPEKCFEFDSSTGTIIKYKKSDLDCPMDVVIPKTIGGTTVKVIGQASFLENWDGWNAAYNNAPTIGDSRRINSVVLPSGLEEIQAYAFYGDYSYTISFNQLSNIDFTKATNLQTIGKYTFFSNQLTNVDFNNLTNLITIGEDAFSSNQLTSVNFSGLTNLQSIGDYAFELNQLTSVDFSELTNLQTIGRSAFENNELTNVNFSGLSNLEKIGPHAFAYNQLTSTDLNGLTKLKTIERNAFGANKINTLKLNALTNLETIGYAAFSENELSNIEIPSSVMNIGDSVFITNQLTSVTIKGKSSSSDFTTYGSNIWGWASGYSDSNIIWNG